MITITATGQACGARVDGVDLSKELSEELVSELRSAWLDHHVLIFPNQVIDNHDLERFTTYFGPFGDDAFFGPLPGHPHVAAIRRDADEELPIFAESWHTDWSFQERPPQGTCLRAVTIPPRGGDTLFADQHKALESMPIKLLKQIEGKRAIHSARIPYAPDGAYGSADQDAGRSMDIRPSEAAFEERTHPLIRPHPETGRLGLFGTLGYVVGIEGMKEEMAMPLLRKLQIWQSQPQFQFRNVWEPDMLIMWDNRSVLHKATGGYEGHTRILHRTTIGSL